MKQNVARNQILKTQPGFIPTRDGPEIEFSPTGKASIKHK